MEDRRSLLESADALVPLAVRKYAEARSWESVDNVRGRLWVFRHPIQRLRQIIIPMDTTVPDFAESMLEVATRLSELEKRALSEVLADLHHPNADVLRFRVVTREAMGGEIPFVEDLRLREGARRALLAAASSAIHPSIHHPRMSRSQAERLLRNCLAGQTERGSYVLKLICPLDEPSEGSTLSDTEPFVRVATTLLLRATSELVESIEKSRVIPFLEEQETTPRVSWNLCDALMRMRPSEGGKLVLSAHWASTWAPPKAPSAVILPAEYFPDLERAARVLRPASENRPDHFLIATVESLEGSIGDDGRRAGDVVLSIFHRDGETLRARASLDADQYAIADRAHMGGLEYVALRGTLRTGPRIGQVDNITSFQPLGEPPAAPGQQPSS